MPWPSPSPAATPRWPTGRAAERRLRALLHRPAAHLLADDLGRLRPRVEEVPDRVQQARGQARPRSRSQDGARARWTPAGAKAARGRRSPGARQEIDGARAPRSRRPRRRLDKAQRRVVRASTRTSASRRPRSTWRATSTRRRPTRSTQTRPTKRRRARRPREAVGASYRLEARGRDRPSATPRRAGSPTSRRRGSRPRRQQKELLRGARPPRGEAPQDRARLRLLRAQPADPRPGEPVAEDQPDHAGEPLRRRDLHAARRRWTAARPATWASTRRATRRRRSPTPPTRTSDLYLRGPAPDREDRLHGLPPGTRPRHELRERRPHAASTRSRRRPGASTRHSKEYERWHHWDLPMLAKGHTESQCAKCHQGVVEVPKADAPQHRRLR